LFSGLLHCVATWYNMNIFRGPCCFHLQDEDRGSPPSHTCACAHTLTHKLEMKLPTKQCVSGSCKCKGKKSAKFRNNGSAE